MTNLSDPQYEVPALKVIGSNLIEKWLDANSQQIFNIVKNVYVTHSIGKTVNPDSYFLRFPDSDKNRIIALPASIEDENAIAGIKWIASFPENVRNGLDRASALLILNDRITGYPLACLEGSAISAARTAASAAVGAQFLHPSPKHIMQLGVIGCGPIAFRTVTLLAQLGWSIGGLRLTDLSQDRARLFQQKCEKLGISCVISELSDSIMISDMILFATSAVRPTIFNPEWFAHSPTVLHMSLRDLAPDIILASQNVTDDVDHCLKANTSLDLAWQQSGHRGFIEGDIAAAMNGSIVPDPSRARIFSPFGMGVLDLAVAREILQSIDDGDSVMVHDFYPTPYVAQAKI
jgi:ornithine cyclodeaminase